MNLFLHKLATLLCLCAFTTHGAALPPASCAANEGATSSSPSCAAANEDEDNEVALLQTNMRVHKHHLAQPGNYTQPTNPNASALDIKMENAANFELAATNDTSSISLANQILDDVANDEHSGGNGIALEEDAEKVMDLLNTAEGLVDPETAAEDGFEFTEDDIANITSKPGHLVMLEEGNPEAIEGDMMPASPEQAALFLQLEKRGLRTFAGAPWTNGIMKYCLASDFKPAAKKAWEKALLQYAKAVPCIKFQDVGLKPGTVGTSAQGASAVCAESPAVFVQSTDEGCWSYVGMIAGIDGPLGKEAQQLNLQSPGCDSVGTIMHEIAHALGIAHEQSRPDRDQFVTIDFDNIKAGNANNFEISNGGDTVQPYDILSVMHYGLHDFAKDMSKPVITVKDAAYAKYTTDPTEYHKYEIGERIGFSQTDVDQFAQMYATVVAGGCPARHLNKAVTCFDKKGVGGGPWKDGYGSGCDIYLQYPEYPADGCCSNKGGWRVQTWDESSGNTPGQSPSPAPTATVTTAAPATTTTPAPATTTTAAPATTTTAAPATATTVAGQCAVTSITLKTGSFATEVGWSIGSCSSPLNTYQDFSDYTEECCLEANVQYTLSCQDSYGDGWNGGSIVINNVEYCKDFKFDVKEETVLIGGT